MTLLRCLFIIDINAFMDQITGGINLPSELQVVMYNCGYLDPIIAFNCSFLILILTYI